jgi:hypothetical protein
MAFLTVRYLRVFTVFYAKKFQLIVWFRFVICINVSVFLKHVWVFDWSSQNIA